MKGAAREEVGCLVGADSAARVASRILPRAVSRSVWKCSWPWHVLSRYLFVALFGPGAILSCTRTGLSQTLLHRKRGVELLTFPWSAAAVITLGRLRSVMAASAPH